METKITKKITGLLALLFVLASFGTYAQDNNKESKTAKQEEAGKALKKWFDSGDIIIEGTIEDWLPSYYNNTAGQRDVNGICHKVKINKVLKGKLNTGYINVKTDGKVLQQDPESVPLSRRVDPEYPNGYKGIYMGKDIKFVFKIKKSDSKKDCFELENKGTYTIEEDAKVIRGEDKSLAEMIQKYCGVNMGVKESNTEKKNTINNGQTQLTPKEAQKNYNNYIQSLNNRKKNLVQKTSNITSCTELYISEYLDGTGNNKSVEIYNPTTSSKSLSGYSILIYHGASYTPTTIALTGTISAFGTHVVSKNTASSAILAKTNQISNNLNFNGDEIIVLNKAAIHIDKIGVIGTAIGSGGWTLTPTGSTVNTDLRRKYNIGIGDTNWTNCKSEWDVLPKDSISNLGQHLNICGVDPDITFSFANAATVGNNYEFDVTAASTGANTYLDNAIVHIQYNSAVFGTHAFASGNVAITNGSSFNNSTYINSFNNTGDGVDTIRVPFGADYNASSWNRTLVTSTPIVLMHISIKIQNCGLPVALSFVNTALLNNFIWYVANANDNEQTASTFNYTNYNYGADDNTIAGCGLQITGITPNSVIAGAYYGTSGGGESLMTINGTGFGSQKGTIYMRNAVNNSTPFYVALDAYDITWGATQIDVLVPSVLFAPNGANYPGTGYVYVKPFGATDSVQSPSIVQIPYILKDVSLGGGTSKQRISFAYRNVTDSAGNGDTAAFCFRFDASTITGNANPNCRPLLKQAIKDWACGLPIRYKVGKDTTISTTSPDAISYITFRNTLSNPNFAAETGVSVNACSSNIFATEADISFLMGLNWQYMNPATLSVGSTNGNIPPIGQADFFTLALHELGHGSLLQHVNDTTDLMYFKTIANTPRPYISSNDQAGGLDNVTWSKTLTYGSCTYNPFTIPASGSTFCSSLTSIHEIGDNTFELNVFPNPANNYLNVTFVKNTYTNNTVKLLNVVGQTVFYKNLGKNEGAQEVINLQGISKGIYMLIVTDDGNAVTKKIIVE